MREDTGMLLRLALAGGASAPRQALLAKLEQNGTGGLSAGRRLCRAAGLSDAQIERLNRPDEDAWRRSREWLAQPGHYLIGWPDPDYPALLRRVSNPPLALFVAGDPSVLWQPAIAVVGSRSPSAGGRDHAYLFARALARRNLCVVSGLAAGIDAAAHAGALSVSDGLTAAVLGTGPDITYPPANASLRTRIEERGAIVSEFPPGTPPKAPHFPSRNRIVAGLALGVLVVEAAERSGALITARLAAESGREVFALPGSIHNRMARGCHRLIREGAVLVESIDEVLDGVATVAAALGQALRQRLASQPTDPDGVNDRNVPEEAPLPPLQRRVWKALGHDPISVDALSGRTGLTAAELSAILLQMELEGWVTVEYGRCSRRFST
ncbi:MAG: DNA-processing protein DprA [Xanthomonadaceae bacterium]|jgi:DNA processing protein|nr:DNA-processing protein DprA [Xanthomonadaceae bacterium]